MPTTDPEYSQPKVISLNGQLYPLVLGSRLQRVEITPFACGCFGADPYPAAEAPPDPGDTPHGART